MRNTILLLIMILFFPFNLLHAKDKLLDVKINKLLSEHYSAYKDKEYFSGIALSIYLPKQAIKNYYIGQIGHEKDSKKVDGNTLFEIGSITKSFTAALILQLEKENKLHLEDSLKRWLPEYSKWSQLTIKSLLNMSSGLPNYSDTPFMNTELFNHPEKQFSNKELIQFVYPPDYFSPPLKTGYFYTNTGYILTAMIIEQALQHSFQTEIENRLIKPAQLEDTFYPVPNLDKAVVERLAHGYGYNPYTNPEWLGKDTQSCNLSWAGAAGALISNSNDIIKWVRALFVENKILDSKQKQRLTQLVSTQTGKAVKKTSAEFPQAFGLGIIQGFDKNIGQYWFYEGETGGFRALYMYVPKNGIIISSLFNSAVNAENDHAGNLMKKIYQTTLSQI